MHASGSKELEAEWTVVVRGKKKKATAPKPIRVVDGWDADNCTVTPEFDNEKAEDIVNNLSFRDPIYITTSENGETRYAYQYYYAPDGAYRLCVCAHIHKDKERRVIGGWVPGHAFITGWVGWHTDTPWDVVDQLRKLTDGGTYPSDKDRYPVG